MGEEWGSGPHQEGRDPGLGSSPGRKNESWVEKLPRAPLYPGNTPTCLVQHSHSYIIPAAVPLGLGRRDQVKVCLLRGVEVGAQGLLVSGRLR